MPANLCVTVAPRGPGPAPVLAAVPWAAGETGSCSERAGPAPASSGGPPPDPSNPPGSDPFDLAPGVGGGLGPGEKEGGRRGRRAGAPAHFPAGGGTRKAEGWREVTGRGGPPARNNGGHRRPGQSRELRGRERGEAERAGRGRWTRGLARPRRRRCEASAAAPSTGGGPPARPPAPRAPRARSPSRGALSALLVPELPAPISWRPHNALPTTHAPLLALLDPGIPGRPAPPLLGAPAADSGQSTRQTGSGRRAAQPPLPRGRGRASGLSPAGRGGAGRRAKAGPPSLPPPGPRAHPGRRKAVSLSAC